MQELILHPQCSAGPVTSISASIHATEQGCRAHFWLEGNMRGIKIPSHVPSTRRDNLWKITCFEIFWQPDGGTFYREFNLSPSSQWACYDFDGLRHNSRDAPVESMAIACAHSDDALMLTADISSELPLPASVALNAIIENSDGTMQFWALAFEDGRPEFHSTTCRALHLGPLS